MQYHGGKTRLSRHIVPVIQRYADTCHTYLEPFLGGASILGRVSGFFSCAVGSDVVPDLVMMWQEACDGWVPPTDVSREEYYALKDAEPSALRGFVGFGCSYGGKWWGGYAHNRRGDNFAQAASRSVVRKARGMSGAEICLRDYREWSPSPGTLVYCDPPYVNTTSYAFSSGFDYTEFWFIAESWSRSGVVVLVSEYDAPKWWEPILSVGAPRPLSKDSNVLKSTENLYALSS